jgi:3-hydroxyisobutyrate dehydrogenase-like beta-hydroxyacid dehydrogenase
LGKESKMSEQRVRIGFVGFGEVGSLLAFVMQQNGADVAAWDLVTDKVKVTLLPPEELAARCDWIFSTVTTEAALDVARSFAPRLRQGQVYVDFNSTSPATKLTIAEVIATTPAGFAEAVILGAIGAEGARARILTGGPRGRDTAELLCRYGLNAHFFSEQTGQASRFKMLRSVFSKGAEALLLEMLAAAHRAGFAEELFRDLSDFMTANPFERVAANWIRTHPLACHRRYHELRQVNETLRELGLTPVMSLATEAFFDRTRVLAGDHPPARDSWQQAVAWLEERLGRT